MPGRSFLHETVRNEFWRALHATFKRVKLKDATAGDARIVEACVKEFTRDGSQRASDILANASGAPDALDLSDLEEPEDVGQDGDSEDY
jgi:hypothetical protein